MDDLWPDTTVFFFKRMYSNDIGEYFDAIANDHSVECWKMINTTRTTDNKIVSLFYWQNIRTFTEPEVARKILGAKYIIAISPITC